LQDKSEAAAPQIRRETIEQQVYVALRREILEGKLKPGQRLVQDDLAARLGTSRIPVRGALKVLEGNGLLTLDAKGAYIVSHFGAADLEEVYALRVLLEPEAARLAIPGIEPAEIDDLKEINEAMRRAVKANDRDQWTELNQQFHLSLYEASRRPRLMRMIRDLWSGRPSFSPIKDRANLLKSVDEHAGMIEALETRNATLLRRLVRDHIVDAGKRWSALLNARDEKPAG
jgi:DNA-binding GntR family transcriptional regulator